MSMSEGFIITSGQLVEGYIIRTYYGPVFGETVYKTSFFKSLNGGNKNIDNSLLVYSEKEMSGITGLIRDAQQTALDKIKKEAKSKGANAVIGLDVESTVEDNGLLHISMYGTAVRIEKTVDYRRKSAQTSYKKETAGTEPVATLVCTETNYDDRFIVHQLVLYNDNTGKILISSNEDITGIKLHFEGSSVFDETKATTSVEAVGFKKIQNSFYESSLFEISKEFYSLSTMKNLCAIIEKYVVGDHVYIEKQAVDARIYIEDSLELRPVNIQTYVEKQARSSVPDDSIANVENGFLYIDPDSGNTAEELFEKMKFEMPSPADMACKYILHQLERIVSNEKRFSNNKKDIFLNTADKLRQNYYRYLADKEVIRIDDNTVECPFCHKRQKAGRISCYACRIPFV